MDCGALILESGDAFLITESRSAVLVTECFPVLPNPPGRVFAGESPPYPYFKPRQKPYWEDDINQEEELVVEMMGILID